MFNVGDVVLYTGEYNSVEKYICIVLSSNERHTEVDIFSTGVLQLREKGWNYGKYSFPTNLFILKEPAIVLSKEEKVALKCKKLWNESKWVKKHPKFAY